MISVGIDLNSCRANTAENRLLRFRGLVEPMTIGRPWIDIIRIGLSRHTYRSMRTQVCHFLPAQATRLHLSTPGHMSAVVPRRNPRFTQATQFTIVTIAFNKTTPSRKTND